MNERDAWKAAWRELRRIMKSPCELAWRLSPENAYGPLSPSPYNVLACQVMQARHAVVVSRFERYVARKSRVKSS